MNDMPNNELTLFNDETVSLKDVSLKDVALKDVALEPFTIEIVRSKKRRRTISAQMNGSVLKISIPGWMSKDEEAKSVADMVQRFKRKIATTEVNLTERAQVLAKRYSLRSPDVIEWSESLTAVWGLCTPAVGHIRLSTRLIGFPSWVLDYVIVHELAHLHVLGHNSDFWELAHRYEKSERAIGYLMAKSNDQDESCT